MKIVKFSGCEDKIKCINIVIWGKHKIFSLHIILLWCVNSDRRIPYSAVRSKRKMPPSTRFDVNVDCAFDLRVSAIHMAKARDSETKKNNNKREPLRTIEFINKIIRNKLSVVFIISLRLNLK